MSPAQRRAVWGAVAQLTKAGLSREDAEGILRDVCRKVSGQEHTSLLSDDQASKVVTQMKERAGRGSPTAEKRAPWGPRGGARTQSTISPAQQHTIQSLAGLLEWDATRLRAFSERQCKKPWPQTMADADALVEALKAMAMRSVPPATIQARAAAIDGHPALDDWQRPFVADLLKQFSAATESGADLRGVMTGHKLLKLLEAEARVALDD